MKKRLPNRFYKGDYVRVLSDHYIHSGKYGVISKNYFWNRDCCIEFDDGTYTDFILWDRLELATSLVTVEEPLDDDLI